MLNTLRKNECNTQFLREMKPGQQVLVKLLEERDYDRVGSLVRLTSKRYSSELIKKGVDKLKVERAGEEHVLVSSLPLKTEKK